jgi:galactonate dehydratase
MEVVDYELFHVPVRSTLLKVTTSDGTVGWGEPTLPGHSRAVRGASEELMEKCILGKSPLPIEKRWERMYRGSFWRDGPVLMTAIAGIDQALWDIKGNHYGAPVYELLGGQAREKVRLYQHIRRHRHTHDAEKRDPEMIGEDAANQVDNGFTCLKMCPTEGLRHVDSPAAVDAAVERIAAVRKAVGPEVDVGLDFHGRTSKQMSKRLASALEPYDPMFYEEAVVPGQEPLLAEIASRTSVPIATGERIHSRWGFKQLFENRSLDIAQPDPSNAGGITEMKKIASMAEAYDIALAPHVPWGPVNLAAGVQVDACCHNVLVQEQLIYSEDHGEFDMLEYLDDPGVFEYDGSGYIEIPDSPGLGIEVDEPTVREQAVGEDEELWRAPMWEHDDGSLAEW